MAQNGRCVYTVVYEIKKIGHGLRHCSNRTFYCISGMLARVPFRVQIMKALFPIIMNIKKAADAKFLVNFRRALSDKSN
jgi:hypothetical protein